MATGVGRALTIREPAGFEPHLTAFKNPNNEKCTLQACKRLHAPNLKHFALRVAWRKGDATLVAVQLELQMIHCVQASHTMDAYSRRSLELVREEVVTI